MEESGKPVIDDFVKRYRIGKPLVEVEVTDDMISDAWVIRSAPCGSTWYVVQQIKKHVAISHLVMINLLAKQTISVKQPDHARGFAIVTRFPAGK